MDMLRSGQDGVDTESLPLREAAHRLGVSVESLRKRAQRGTIAAHKVQTVDGETWFVSLPRVDSGQDKTGQDTRGGQDGNGQATVHPSPLDANTAEIIAVLREQLAVKDEQIAHLMQIVAVQSARTLPSGEAITARESRDDKSPIPIQMPPHTQTNAQRGVQPHSRGILRTLRRWFEYGLPEREGK